MARPTPYQQGYYDGRKLAEKIVKSDIAGIYGAACIVLKKQFDFDYDTSVDFLNNVQETWDSVVQSGESMIDVCERETGINLVQRIK